MLATAPNSWTLIEAAHLLNRAGFGGNPTAIQQLHALGREKAVDSLLSPTEPISADPPPVWSRDENLLADLKRRAAETRQLRVSTAELSAEAAALARREAQKEIQRETRLRILEAQAWWFGRMVNTTAPLREKMTLFWHDHFATSLQKVRQPAYLVRQNQLFRQHAFGNFRQLTQAILMDPAMMLYLDTQNSKKGRPNENFAREVMELFTLGEGHYSEQDVREAARAFTGYQLNRSTGRVFHNKRQWDATDKTVFGKTGPFTGKDVIDLIFQKPETARFMAGKLWEFFVVAHPSEPLLSALASDLQQSEFRIAPVLRRIFLSEEFYQPTVIRGQIKSPVQYLVTLLKQLEIGTPEAGFAAASGSQLGQVLFAPPNVAGWDWGKAWINTNTLLTRYNIAGSLTTGSADSSARMAATPNMAAARGALAQRANRRQKGPAFEKIAPRAQREQPAELVDALISRFFQSPLPEKARNAMVEYAEAKKGEILTNRETAELCHLILSTPYYQLC
jgi:uncharacterized protein (DUF1800 family)